MVSLLNSRDSFGLVVLVNVFYGFARCGGWFMGAAGWGLGKEEAIETLLPPYKELLITQFINSKSRKSVINRNIKNYNNFC